jgi:thiol-disulfide isomerase/thioredoxin
MRVFIGVWAFAWLAGCVSMTPLPPTTGDDVKRTPLQLRLPKYPKGETFDLLSERGNVVLLDVWATWCEPCRDALPVYEALAKQYGDRGLRVYAINVDAGPAQITEFLNAIRANVPVLVDKDGTVSDRDLNVHNMPTTFLVDRRGFIRKKHEGFSEEALQKYQTEIESLLAESPK